MRPCLGLIPNTVKREKKKANYTNRSLYTKVPDLVLFHGALRKSFVKVEAL
jgi:hypothetical protein